MNKNKLLVIICVVLCTTIGVLPVDAKRKKCTGTSSSTSTTCSACPSPGLSPSDCAAASASIDTAYQSYLRNRYRLTVIPVVGDGTRIYQFNPSLLPDGGGVFTYTTVDDTTGSSFSDGVGNMWRGQLNFLLPLILKNGTFAPTHCTGFIEATSEFSGSCEGFIIDSSNVISRFSVTFSAIPN